MSETTFDEIEEKKNEMLDASDKEKKDAPKEAKYLIEVDGKKGYLKNPNRHTIEVVLALVMPSKGSPKYIKAGETILRSCWIKGGDEEILNNDDLLVSAAMQAYKTVKLRSGSIKKL